MPHRTPLPRRPAGGCADGPSCARSGPAVSADVAGAVLRCHHLHSGDGPSPG
ncbi:hypothetical protein [Kitasatospora sp. NPDC089509]|uniref:hypothetical protein n=1 Tax=Kitasatospora sp. NPDC089509 TaxID=3364079 RepID=UPI0037F1A3A3